MSSGWIPCAIGSDPTTGLCSPFSKDFNCVLGQDCYYVINYTPLSEDCGVTPVTPVTPKDTNVVTPKDTNVVTPKDTNVVTPKDTNVVTPKDTSVTASSLDTPTKNSSVKSSADTTQMILVFFAFLFIICSCFGFLLILVKN